jgi:insulysin
MLKPVPSSRDQDDLPGLAHFCEHMLFLGTSRFPDEADYKRYLSEHSGSSNAYTYLFSPILLSCPRSKPALPSSSSSLEETNYHFDCTPAGLPDALARHSQFFTSPLFLPSCTERELNAVDSEFRRNLQLDARRLFQLGKATTSRKAGSVYWKFGTGSKQTLWDEPCTREVDVRQRLLQWYGEHYSANLMSLVIISTRMFLLLVVSLSIRADLTLPACTETLDELTELTLAEYSGIPNLNSPANIFDAPPLSSDELKVHSITPAARPEI